MAETFSGRAQRAETALLDGEAGLVWAPGGTVRVAFAFTVVDGRITGIEQIADPADLGGMEVSVLGG